MTPQARKPTPERAAQAQAEYPAFRQLVDDSARLSHESAERWRNGLAAILAIALGSLVLKGPEDAHSVVTGWRIALTAMVGLGGVLAVGGLWLALRASAGIPHRVAFDEILDEYTTVRQFRLREAARAARFLSWARWSALISIVLLLGAQLLAWWAPTGAEPPKPAVVVCVQSTTVVPCRAGP